MDKRTFQRAFSFILLNSLVTLLLFQTVFSAPVNSSLSYDTFLKNITRDNCAFPSGIVLPLKDSPSTFQYFSEVLKICKAPEAMKRSLEAVTLCNEIYDALRNITCHSDKNIELPEIKIEFSENVCKDINSLQLHHSLEEKSLLQHLTDMLICEMMCEDDFLPACKMLLWSFQLRKQIEGIPHVQPIQNSPSQENDAGLTKTLNPEPDETLIEKGQELKSNEVPVENTDKKELDQTLKNNKDKLANDGENEIPEEPIKKASELAETQEKTLKLDSDNELIKMKEQTSKLDDKKQHDQVENDPHTAKEEVEIKTQKQTPTKDIEPIKENKIDVDEGPPKLSDPNLSKKIVHKNNPVVPIPEISNKTELKKDIITVQNNLLPESPKESPVEVKPIDTKNDNLTSNNLKPVVPELQNELNKLQDVVSHASSSSKAAPIGANEAKVSIKSEVTLAKEDEVADNKIIPAIGKEDAFTVSTIANLEKMEEGNDGLEPAVKDPDAYTLIDNMESEGDFQPEYDYDDSSKNKKPEELDSGKISKPSLAENDSPKFVEDLLHKNSFVGGSGDILSTFPEQEDSHFFFYFLTLVLVLMAGYLLFHNKQKIIALIVEGRHERRRRSHGLGYKKLETK